MDGFVVIVSGAIQLYILLVFVWVLGSWFPQWRYQSWFQTVESVVKPYMDLFKAVPLRMGMIDLTPMLAIFVLYILQQIVLNLARTR